MPEEIQEIQETEKEIQNLPPEENEGEEEDNLPDPDDMEEEDDSTPAPAKVDERDIVVREAVERANRAEQQMQNFAQQQRDAQAAAQEKEWLAVMSPEEKSEYFSRKAQENINNTANQVRNQLQSYAQEATDKADFYSKVATIPVYGKFATEVEKFVSDQKRQGRFVTRELALQLIAGQKMIQASTKGNGTKQKKKASENMARAKTASTKVKSDVRGGSKGEVDNSRKARLQRLVDSGQISERSAGLRRTIQ